MYSTTPELRKPPRLRELLSPRMVLVCLRMTRSDFSVVSSAAFSVKLGFRNLRRLRELLSPNVVLASEREGLPL